MPLKTLKILTFVVLYLFFLLLLFSETFILDFQELRRKTILSSSGNEAEVLYFPKKTWDGFSDKGEIQYKGDYYDVKSFTSINKMVKVIAHKDTFEVILKAIAKNLHSKSKKKHSLVIKKSIVFYFFENKNFQFHYYSLGNSFVFNYNLKLKNNYLFSLFRPPIKR